MAPTPPARLGGPVPPRPREAAVDQPRHGAHPRRVASPSMPVGLAERLEAPQPPDAVLHHHPLARERAVVGDILGRAVPPTRLAAPRGPARVQLLAAHLAQVTA